MIDDIRLALMCGTDIPVPECQITIHQPSIEEISFLGEKDFFTGVQILTLHKTMFVEDKNLLSEVNNFQIFMTIIHDSTMKEKKEAVIQVLTILFPTKKVLFTPNSLLFQPIDLESGGQMVVIDEKNFEILQEKLRKVFCTSIAPMDQQAFNPRGDKAKAIAEKIMRGREKIAAEKNSSNASIFSQYISVLSIGVGYSIQELIKLTMFQLYDLVERYYLWMNWDLDVRTRLAGGKPDDKPDNWMKNIH